MNHTLFHSRYLKPALQSFVKYKDKGIEKWIP